VTTGSPTAAVPGALGQPGTHVLFGNTIADNPTSGARASVAWSGANDCYSWEVNGFWLSQQTNQFHSASTGALGSKVLSRPFFNPNTLMEDADPIALPGVEAGNIDVHLVTNFYGGEFNARYTTGSSCCGDGIHFGILWGFRFLGLDERLEFRDQVKDLPLGAATSQTFNLNDSFQAANRFYGGQVGINAGYQWSCMCLAVDAKVAIGDNVETTRLQANTQIFNQATGALVGQAFDRAFLVQPSNAGSFQHHQLAFASELTVTWSIILSQHWSVSAGYNFLYWGNAARAADQIDRTVNIQPVQQPGQPAPPQLGVARPLPIVNDSPFSAQGLIAGVEFRY
jgi:hypothetical protein